jgi:hypothetical protein
MKKPQPSKTTTSARTQQVSELSPNKLANVTGGVRVNNLANLEASKNGE